MKPLVVPALMMLAAAASADALRVRVSRVRRDLFQVDGTNVFVQTRRCDRPAAHLEATLVYTPRSGDHITFDDGSTCRVVDAYERASTPSAKAAPEKKG